MRRGLALTLIALSAALPGAAQSPGPRLHRFIPGDLSLAELPPGVLSPPGSPDEFGRATSGTGWSEHQDPNADVLHPRDQWAPDTRGIDPNTRSRGETLHYREVFTPSIAPFKRTHAYDAVDEFGRLTVRDPSLRPLRLGDVPALWSHEHTARFTGDIHVELALNAPTPIPSVAGEQAVMSFRTEPEVPLGFFQDSAGNLFVRAETARTVHLVYVLAAPQHAFVAPGDLIPNYLPGNPMLRGAEPEPAVPPFLSASYGQVLAHVGVRRTDPFRPTLDALIRYFRNYRDAELPESRETNLYVRLALGGVGACRHRAYAFALTLQALGVPARYVGNEAHAWAEVAIAGVGWSRVDLGGWDVNLRDENPQHERFVPENPDPFPRPENYSNGYSSQAASATPDDPRHRDHHRPDEPQNQGLGPDHEDPSRLGQVGNPTQPGVTSGTGVNTSSTSGTQDATEDVSNRTSGPTRPGLTGRTTATGDTPDETVAPAVNDGSLEETVMHRTDLHLLSVQSTEAGNGRGVVRGTLLDCAGEAHDETGAPVADLPVFLEIMRGKTRVELLRNGRRESALGTTVTNDQGRFQARVMLPLELEAGTYSIRARTPGDAHHQAARVE